MILALLPLLFAHPAVDGATLDRLGAIRPEIEIAADVAGLEPAVLAAAEAQGCNAQMVVKLAIAEAMKRSERRKR